MANFYKETIKNSEPKDIKKSAEILTERNRLLGEDEIIKRDCTLIIEKQSKLANEENVFETKKKSINIHKKKKEEFYKRSKETKGNKEQINNLIKNQNEEHEKKN